MCKNGVCSYFCCVGSSCEGVDFNHCLFLQCKLCMTIKDVYFGKGEMFFDAHVEMAFMFTSTI